MERLLSDFCWNCGRLRNNYSRDFCSDKCKKTYERTHKVKVGDYSGYSKHRKITGEFQDKKG